MLMQKFRDGYEWSASRLPSPILGIFSKRIVGSECKTLNTQALTCFRCSFLFRHRLRKVVAFALPAHQVDLY
jgi:hypothetical protein